MESESGRIALITGAAGRGLGQAVARRLASRGDRVVLTDIHGPRAGDVAAAVAKDFPDTTVVGYQLDAGDRAGIDAVVAEVTATLGQIQILVNNAAVDILGTIFDYDPADWDRTLAVNLSGPWYLCRRIMPLMRAAGGGVVVNVGSIASQVGGSGFEGAYAAAKGGLNALTRALARDGAPFGIRAVTVSTGLIADSKIVLDNPDVLELPDVRSILGSYPVAAEIADAIAFLTSNSARHITGESLDINGGAYLRP